MKTVLLSVACFSLLTASFASARIVETSANGFTFEHEVDLPLSPEAAFDAFTGDISGWWDHTFSGDPLKLYIEPRAGGCFCEVFDESGDGVEHARVTAAHRGRMLRMVGPLGMAGEPFEMSMTLMFEERDGGCHIKMTGSAWGMISQGWDKAVDGVWHHFLIERFKPWAEKRQ